MSPNSDGFGLDRITPGRGPRRRPQPRLRGYVKWRPNSATEKLLDQVQDVLDEYAAHLPLTVRQIFYRLVGAHGYAKDERAYKRLIYMLGRARRAEMIPFDAIRDDGVVTYSSRWYDGPEEFWDDAARRARGYRENRQAGQRQYVELWCEAHGMAPQLRRVADEFSVPVYSNGGFVSISGVRGMAAHALDHDVPTVIMHVGDFDPSGESIFTAMTEDAAAFVEADRVINTQRIVPVRVALTVAQVKQHGLPAAPPKAKDSRTKKWVRSADARAVGGTVQAEALPPDVLAEIVRAALEDVFDMGRVAHQIESEKQTRIQLLRALARGEDGDDE
jgi:hypothetical protein